MFDCTMKRSKERHKLTLILIFVTLVELVGICADQQSAPRFMVHPSVHEGVVIEGQQKVLRCEAIGVPRPQLQWLKDGLSVGNNSYSTFFRITSVTRDDAGYYQCLASNSVGAVLSEKAHLQVAYIASKGASQERENLEVANSDAVIFHPPAVSSIPTPTSTWSKVGKDSLFGIKYSVTQHNKLVILSADKNDEGEYQVTLTNSHTGQDIVGPVISLTVQGGSIESSKPVIVVPPKDSVFEETIYPTVLECIANGKPLENLQTVWSKDGIELPLTGLSHYLAPWNRSLTLLNIGTAHSGTYKCEVLLRGSSFQSVVASANVSVQVKPKIVRSPFSETAAEIGQNVLLPCSATGVPAPEVTWYRNAILVAELNNKRFTVLENGSLFISTLEMSDSGVFQCVAKNPVGEVRATSWLPVKISAPVFLKPPVNVTALDGKDIQIPCNVSGAPVPNTTWTFNDVIPVHSEGRFQILDTGALFITSVVTEDAGKYSCTRTNNAGSVTGFGYLTVLVKTQIIQPPADTKVILSSTAELPCKVSHDPSVPYFITWYFGDQQIYPSSSGRLQVLNDGTLQVRQARNTDIGTYTCSVISAGGNETRSARLDVIELPHPPLNIKAEVQHTYPKSVNISWSKPFDGNSPITSFIVQMRTLSSTGSLEALVPWVTAKANISGNTQYFIFTKLKPAAAYQFRVSAINGVGEGSSSDPSNPIMLPPEPPGGPPQSVVGGARSATSIMLQWQPPQEGDRNGELLGYAIRFKLAGYTKSPWTYQNITTEAQHSIILQDLIVWQKYEIQAAAYNEKGIGVFSDSIFIRTREGVPQAVPTKVRVDSLNSTAVIVKWFPPDPQLINGINQGYKVEAWSGEPSDNAIPSISVLVPPSQVDPLAEHSTVISGLRKYKSYNITVLCFTSPGNGPRSEPVVVSTKQDVPGAVKTFKFEDILDSSVRVLWTPPEHVNGILLGYTLKYYVRDSPESAAIKNITADTTYIVIKGLKPVTAYTFEIFAWTIVGFGPSAIATIQSGIPPVLPGPPTKLAVSNIGPFSVVLQFTPGFDGNTSITKWSVESQTRRTDKWTDVYEVSDPEAMTIQVKNLVPFTEYRLRILATNVVGSSSPSEPTKYFQTIQAPPSHAPYNVTVRAVNSKALRVRWTPLPQVDWYGIPRGYNISFRVADKEDYLFQYRLLEDHNANSFVLDDLEEFTPYEVFVQAFNDVGSSGPSSTASEWTREASPSMGPTEVTTTASTSTTVVVTWNVVPTIHQNGIIEGYKVVYRAKTVPTSYKVIEDNATFTTTLTELRKYTVYTVQVLGYTRIGDGALSLPPVTVTTLEDVPGVPSNISFPDVSTTTARIIWDVPEEPNGEILGYRISYHQRDTPEASATKDVSPVDRTLKTFDLTPEVYYLFLVTAKTKEGWGKEGQALVFTTNNREKPQPPSTPYISQSQVQARQITFSWTPGRDGYAPLRYYTVQQVEGLGPWKTIPVKVDPTFTTYMVTGLKPYTRYLFRIQAVNDIGASGWSEESNDTWTLPAAPEIAPTNVVITPYTTTSITVTWKPLPSEAWNGDTSNPGYRIEYCLLSVYTGVPQTTGECQSEQIEGMNTSTVTIQNMEQDKIYEVKVFGYNGQGDGPASHPSSVYVGEAVPTGKPRDIHLQALSSTEVNVTWNPPLENEQNGDLLGYKIFYRPVIAPIEVEDEMEAVPVFPTSYILMDLRKFTNYSVQILAFNPAGDGPRSSKWMVRTKPDFPGSPGPLKFTDITMTSLNVSWDPPEEPNGIITGYLITYETAEPDIEFSKEVRQKVIHTYLTVHGLRENITYTFSVRAETVGYGPESVSNITLGPQEGSPKSPIDLTIHHTRSSATLNWKNGHNGNSPILGYLIEAKQTVGFDGNYEWQTLALLDDGPQTSYTVSYQNLLPSTGYKFRLFSKNKFGISPPAVAPELVETPKKYYSELKHAMPFYREVWFLVMLAACSLIIIILIVAILCVKSKAIKYKKEMEKTLHDDRISMDDGGFATFELHRSKKGTLCKNSFSRKSANSMIAKSPPRPSPASITYSDEDDTKGYDDNCDSSSLTEKPSEMSSSDSQCDSDDSDAKSEPHSFVNHYANVNDTLRQSWKRQRIVKPPSYTDSEPESSTAVGLNGGRIVMNNMAGSRAPLPGFSSFV